MNTLLLRVYVPRTAGSAAWALVYGVCAVLEGAVLVATLGLVDIDLPAMWVDVTTDA